MWRWTCRSADRPPRPLLAAFQIFLGLSFGLAAGQGRAAVRGGSTASPAAQLEAPAAPESLLLALSLNGALSDDTVRALRLPGGLAISDTDWQGLHLRNPGEPGTVVDGRRYFYLDAIAGLRWRIDESSQTLFIDAPPSAFAGGAFEVDTAGPGATTPSAWGGFANYDLQWQRAAARGATDGRDALQGLVDLGTFGPAGHGRATALVRDNATLPHAVRLDTTWTRDLPQRMSSLRMGDSIGNAGAWGRAMRFGGVQYATDFTTRPGFLTFPLPALQGEAALPSTVDVYVNNTRRMQGQVPAGPFSLTDVPIVTGSGQVRIVVRDLLGREQVIQQPYYASPSLLRPGLRAFSYDVGAVREDYGLASDHYGKFYAAMTERHGIDTGFTRELRAEVLGRQVALGATGLWLVPSVGMLNVSGVASQSETREGGMLMGAIEHQSDGWNGSVQLRRASRGFSQAGQGDALAPRVQATAAVGASLGGTAVGVSYVQAHTWDAPDRQRLLSVNLARSLGRLSTIGLFALRDLSGQGGTTVSLSLSVAIDGPTSASVSMNRSAGGGSTRSLQVQRSIPEATGFGYQLTADRGDLHRDTVQALWQTDLAMLQAGASRVDTGRETRLGAIGSVAWLDGSVFMARRIDGSFAVVEVGGFSGVPILHENREVARTDARGRALVGGLRGYEPNRIGIDAAGLPFDAEIDSLELQVVPPSRSGVVVRVPVRQSHGATFRLVDAEGKPLPAGTLLRVEGLTQAFPLGFDGRGFVTGVGTQVRAQAKGPLGPCSVVIETGPSSDDLPDLGTLSCR